MTDEMRGRCVLVTGAGSGIGLETVRALIEQRARVAAVVMNEEQSVFLKHEVPQAKVLIQDLSVLKDCEKLPQLAEELLGSLDGLVCCAGVFFRGSSDETTLEQWNKTFDLNLTSTFFLVRAMIAHVRTTAAVNASVVIVSSQLGQVGYPTGAAYAASKAALNSVVRSLALEWAAEGIRINAVAPGPVSTPMTKEALSNPQANARLVNGVPMGRVGEPDEISHAISFLMSNRASFITGQVLCVDGGYTCR